MSLCTQQLIQPISTHPDWPGPSLSASAGGCLYLCFVKCVLEDAAMGLVAWHLGANEMMDF